MVSVIIPVYNRQQYLEECVRSVLNQTYKNFEILLIDDGSEDDSPVICRALAQENSCIRFFESSHKGVSAARNIGLEASKGDFVFFIDSDDVIHPDLFGSLVTGLRETDAAIAGTGCVFINEHNWDKVYKYIEKNRNNAQTKYLTFDEVMEDVFCVGETPLSLLGGVMMKRELVGDTKFCTDLFIGEDFYFIYENMIKQASVVYLDKKWYFARNHSGNSSWDFGYSGFMNRVLRRELVWKSEEAQGRKRYAAAQKNAVFGLYKSFMNRKTLTRSEKSKIKKVMRSYGKVLFRDLYAKNKVQYVFCLWIPGGYQIIHFIEPLSVKIARKLRGRK